MRLPLTMLLAALFAGLINPRVVVAGDCENAISRAFTVASPDSLLANRTAISRAFTIAPPNSLLATRTAVSRAFTIAPPGSLLPTRTAVSRAFTISPETGKACELQVTITSPQEGSTFAAGYPIFLAAQAYFGQPPYTFAWTSDLDGPLGNGPSLSVSTLSAGDHQVTVTAQDSSQASKQDSVSVTVIAAADLAIPYFSAPTSGLAGQSFTVSWSVANNGTVTAFGPWPDTVFISTDATLSPGDPSLGSLQAPESLALPPGTSYASGFFATWPSPGTYWLFVKTDVNNAIPEYSGETNNVAMIGPISIQAQPLPDVTVTQVTPPPADIPSGTATSVTYSVRNIGVAATVANWSDRVLLHGPGLPAGGLVLAQPGSPLLLLPGEGYTKNAPVPLPHDISGTFTIEVRTDASSVMAESNEQNNALTSVPFAIALEPQPDLQVLNVVVPPFAFSGGPLTVGWTVLNAGTGVTDNGSWQHAIYLSTNNDSSVTPGDLLLDVTGPAGIAPLPGGGSAVFNHVATLAASVSGTLYAKVFADHTNVITESGFEGNNVTASVAPVNITLTPSPDLVPTTVYASAPLPYPGQPFDVTWNVFNNGGPPLNAAAWSDAIYLSSDTILDAGDHFLGAFSAATSPDGFGGYSILPYTRTRTRTIPDDLAAGNYYLIVQVDQSDNLFEASCFNGAMCEANNVLPSVQPLAIQSVFADLVVAITAPPATPALAGSTVSVSWQVANNGPIPTPVAQWQDRISLSLDAVLDGGDTLLKTVNHTGLLGPGGSYQASADITLPMVSGGPYFVLVQADGGGQVVEPSGAETNVATSSIVLVASPSDPGAGKIDQQTYAELTVTAVAAQGALGAGESLAVQWTVANTAAAATNTGVWTDRVWLSSDMTFGGDLLLGALTHTGGLAPGASYMVDAGFPTGLELSGTFHVFVETDATNAVLEIDNANNAAAAPAPTLITAADAANLVVASVQVAGTAISGQPLGVTWTVSNFGEAVTNVAQWNESIYLSLNQFLDPGDIHLQTVTSGGCGPLAIGGSCQRAAGPVVPLGVNGLYFIIVRTNSNGAVYEAGRVDDNIGTTTVLAQVIVPTPSDLVVGAFPPPPGPFVLGEDAAFTWAINNAGPAAVEGNWLDALYLSSTDPIFDLEDTHIGTFPNGAPGGGLPSGGSAQGSATVPVPGVLPGTYWIVVRSDVFNNIPETNEANNTGFLLGPVDVSAHVLPLSEPEDPMPVSGKLPAGRGRYYELMAPAGETVRLVLQHDNPSAWTEMFVKYEGIPTSGDFDFSGSNIGMPDQEVVIPTTQSGSYFVLVRATAVLQDPATIGFNLVARRTPFEISAVHPPVVGAARVTLTVSGAQFSDSSGFGLRHVETGAIFTAVGAIVENAAQARVTFDLEGAPLGAYDVLGSNGPMESELAAALSVEPPSDFIVVHDVLDLVPGRLGYTTSVTLSVHNGSNRDIANAMVALFTEDIGSLDWSLDGLSEPVGNGEWRVKLVYVRQLPPEETITFPISVNAGVDSGLSQVEYLADVVVLSDAEFEARIQAFAERVRQKVLQGQVAVPPALLDLAEDAAAWWDLLRPLYVDAGHLDQGILPPGQMLDCALLGEPLEMLDPELALAGAQACLCKESDFCDCPAFPPCTGDGELDGGPRDGRALPCNLVVCFGAGNPIALGAGAVNCGPGVACQEFTLGVDPNEKDGEDGFGAQQWIGRHTTQSYVIFFENIAEATAPVARVEIRDPLDLDLNPASFRVGQINFGGVVVNVPPNKINFYTRLDLTATLGLLVDVFAGIDATLNPPEAFWVIQALDPITGLPPVDGVSGFLPPNQNGSGQGAVSFSVRPGLNVVSLATIENDASIIFDVNAPLTTSLVTNTVDADAPISGIAALPPVVVDPAMVLTVFGGDVGVGSGLASFNLMVAVDGGPLTPFAFTSGSQVPFAGEPGHVYGFRSQAIDNAGNAEQIDANPQVVTAVALVKLVESSDSGVSGDHVTNDTTPSFLAVSAPQSAVLFQVIGPGVALSATVPTVVDGRASYTVATVDALPDGDYIVMSTGSGVTVQASFTIDATAPTVLAWRTAADHGPLGELSLLVDDGTATSEPRATGVSRLLLQFPQGGDPVSSLLHDGVSILGTNIAGQPVGLDGINIAVTPRPSEFVLELAFSPALPDQALYCISVEGLRDPSGNAVAAEGATRQVTALFGDASGDRRVNNTDVGGVILLLGTDPIDPGLPYHVSSDVDQDGNIDEDDLTLVLEAVGPDARFIPSPCGLSAVAGLDRYAGLSGVAEMPSAIDGPPAPLSAFGAAAPPEGGGGAGAGGAPAQAPTGERPSVDTRPGSPWWVTTVIDPDRLAFFVPPSTDAARFEVAGVLEGEVVALPLAGWSILERPGAATFEEALLAAGCFVSPVLVIDAPGAWAILTPSAFLAFEPDVDGDAAEKIMRRFDPGFVITEVDCGGAPGLYRVELSYKRGGEVGAALHDLAGDARVRFAEPDVILAGAYPLEVPILPEAVARVQHPGGTIVAVFADGIAPVDSRLRVLDRWSAIEDAEVGPLGTAIALRLGDVTVTSVQVAVPRAGRNQWVSRPSWIIEGLAAARRQSATITINPLACVARSRAVASVYDGADGMLHLCAVEDIVGAASARAADLDRDGDVDGLDLLHLLEAIVAGSGVDVNGDGAVDLGDVVALIELPAASGDQRSAP